MPTKSILLSLIESGFIEEEVPRDSKEGVLAAIDRLGLERMTAEEIREARRHASAHNPETGYTVDAAGVLYCGLILKAMETYARREQDALVATANNSIPRG